MAVKAHTISAVTVTSAGTRVQISSEKRPVSSILFQADPSNTGLIYVGDSTVSSSNGIALGAKDSYEVSGDERPSGLDELILSDFWVDASSNSQIVRVQYFKRRHTGE